MTNLEINNAIAKIEGLKVIEGKDECIIKIKRDTTVVYSPVTDWHTGGPLIEKYNVSIDKYNNNVWMAEVDDPKVYGVSNELRSEIDKSLLKAAMVAIIKLHRIITQ